MVALPSQLPLLRIGSHELSTYEATWVAECIREAAVEAGHLDWWFADDIAKAVLKYLQTRYESSAITLDQLQHKIGQTLRMVGFHDVAVQLSMVPPLIRLNLREMVRQAEGMELAFFQLLSHRIVDLKNVGARKVSLTGAKEAIKHLRAAKHWTARCQSLEDHIVNLVRHRMAEEAEGAYELNLEAA